MPKFSAAPNPVEVLLGKEEGTDMAKPKGLTPLNPSEFAGDDWRSLIQQDTSNQEDIPEQNPINVVVHSAAIQATPPVKSSDKSRLPENLNMLDILARSRMGAVGQTGHLDFEDNETRLALAKIEELVNMFTDKYPDRKVIINFAIRQLAKDLSSKYIDLCGKHLTPLNGKSRLSNVEIRQALDLITKES